MLKSVNPSTSWKYYGHFSLIWTTMTIFQSKHPTTKGSKSNDKTKKNLVLWEQFFRKSLKPISQERGFGNDYAWVVHKRGDRVKESEWSDQSV